MKRRKEVRSQRLGEVEEERKKERKKKERIE